MTVVRVRVREFHEVIAKKAATIREAMRIHITLKTSCNN